jgi:hypothetical protein
MSLPAGTIIAYLGSEANLNVLESQGWLNCDGRSVPTTDYGQLWSAIGNTFGSSGQGSFNLPDLRGMFLRSVDPAGAVDPDFKLRTSPDPQNKSVVGPLVGSRQAHEVVNHQHNWSGNFGNITYDGNDIAVQLSGEGGNQGTLPTTNIDGGGNETRPANVYAYYLIFAGS